MRLRVRHPRLSKRIKLCLDEKAKDKSFTMNKLKSGQREKVRQFVQFTNSTERIALTCLQNSNWNVEMACDIYFQNPTYFNSLDESVDSGKINALFRNYANDSNDDVGPDRIGPHGMVRLLGDLQVDPASRITLILAWKLKAETQCEFSKEEFATGLTAMKTDSLEKLRTKLSQLNDELNRKESDGSLRDLYVYAFDFGRSCAQRTLTIDVAFAYWNMLFEDHARYPVYPILEKFLREREQKGISRDQWNLVYDYIRDVGLDISKYDTNGAWPVLLDEFVEYIKNTQQN